MKTLSLVLEECHVQGYDNFMCGVSAENRTCERMSYENIIKMQITNVNGYMILLMTCNFKRKDIWKNKISNVTYRL